MGIFHACILAGSPEKVTKMDEKVSATDKCYRARGCLLKFRAHCENTERSFNMRSCQQGFQCHRVHRVPYPQAGRMLRTIALVDLFPSVELDEYLT